MGYQVQFRHLSALRFDQGSIEVLRTYSVPSWAWINLLLSCLFMSLPLTRQEIPDTPFVFARLVAVFLVVVLLCYLVSKLIGSSVSFTKFLYTISTVNLFGSAIVSVLTYLSLFVFEWLMNNSTLSNLIASILPFYIFVLFGFSVDGASGLPEGKGILLGAFGISVLYVLYYFFA